MYAPFPHTRYIPRFTAIRIGRRAAWGTRLALVAARRSQRDWRPRVTGRTCGGESRDGGIWRGNDTRRQSSLGTVPFELVGTLWLFETVIGGRFSSRTYLNEDNVRRPKKKNQAKNQSGGRDIRPKIFRAGLLPSVVVDSSRHHHLSPPARGSRSLSYPTPFGVSSHSPLNSLSRPEEPSR